MALIQYAAPWDSQPQEAVDTDTSLDIGRDIEFGFVGSRSVGNFPRPVFGVHNGTQSVRTKDGIATLVDTVATSPNYQSFGVPSFTLGGPYSVAVRVNVTANSGPSYDRIFHCNYNASGNNHFGFFLTPASDGNPNRVYFDSTSSDGTRGIIGYSTSHSTYTANQFQTYLAVNDGTNLILYCPEGPVLSAALSSKFFGTLIGDLRIGLDQVGSDNGAPCEVSAAFIWSKAISPASAARFVQGNNYLEIFAPRTIWVPVSAGGGGASGTSATTNANDTPSASGTTTVTGTSSKTNANDTSSASGTTTVVGTSAKTNANDVSAASGTTTVIGTLAKTNADDTSAASGTVGSSGTTGTVAATNANDTAAASGTTKIVGTLSTTNANDAATASGVAGAVSGTVAVTNANDTASAVGDAGAPVASGAGMGFSMSRMRRLVKIQFNGKLYQAFEEDIPELLETLEEQAEQKIKKKRNARAKPAPVATVVSAPADVLPSLQSRIDDVNHSIGVLWGVDEDEDEELLWLML